MPASQSEPFTTTSSKAAFDHFKKTAKAVPTDNLEVCKVDVQIARVNVERGVAAIKPHLKVLKKKLPKCPTVEILELPALVLALMYAAGKVTQPLSTGAIDERLATLRPMREAGLLQLEVFAILGDIPREVPAGIRRGSGPLDAARDALAIVGAFHDYKAKLQNRHPFTPATLKKLGEDGDWLVQNLKPSGAKDAPAERSKESILRDQIWALVCERHEQLRQAGAVVFGLKNLDAEVPPLGARVGTSKGNGEEKPAAKEEAKAAPAAKDAGANGDGAAKKASAARDAGAAKGDGAAKEAAAAEEEEGP